MKQIILMQSGGLAAWLGQLSAGSVVWLILFGLIVAALGGIAAARWRAGAAARQSAAKVAAPLRSLMIIYYQERWYVPRTALLGGTYTAIEPVAVVAEEIDALAAALRDALDYGNPEFPEARPYSIKGDAILRAAGLRSWYRIAAYGGSYGLAIEPQRCTLYVSKLDRRGRFVSDSAKMRRWDALPPLEEIAEILIDDIRRQAAERANR